MLLQNNGRFSCGKGTRHVAIRYFFISDRIEMKDIRVVYYPTEEMIADYFTKPLQGALFRKFQAGRIMAAMGGNMREELDGLDQEI